MEELIILPSVFFGALLLFFYIKRGIDPSTYITSLYFIVGVFTIIAYNTIRGNVGGTEFLQKGFSLRSAMVYCGLISLCIIPIYKLNTNSIDFSRYYAPRIIKFLTYTCFIAFAFKIIYNFHNLVFILSYGDLGALRTQFYAGATFGEGAYPFFMKPFNIIASCSAVLFPLFFICLITMKTSLTFKLMMLLGTTTNIIDGVLSLDRSSFVTWIMTLGLNIVIFWPHLTKQIKRKLTPAIGTLIGLALIYISAMTISRFEDSKYGSEGGVIAYSGQSYINFCYLFDNYDNHSGFNGKYFFPATHEFIIKDYEGNLKYQQEMSVKSHYLVTIFYTFLGSFLIDNNQAGPFIFVTLYLILFLVALHKKKRNYMSLKNFIFCYFLMIIPMFGIFGYPYTRGITSLGFICLFFVFNLKIFKSKKIRYCMQTIISKNSKTDNAPDSN